MRKQKIKSAMQLREERLNKLIKAAQEKYSNEELFEEFLKCLDWSEKRNIAKTIALDYDIMEEIKDNQKNDGFVLLKLDSMQQKEKLTDFLTTVIYPYYNEQQTNLFN